MKLKLLYIAEAFIFSINTMIAQQKSQNPAIKINEINEKNQSVISYHEYNHYAL